MRLGLIKQRRNQMPPMGKGTYGTKKGRPPKKKKAKKKKRMY